MPASAAAAAPSSGFEPVGMLEPEELLEAKHQVPQRPQVLSLLHCCLLAVPPVSWLARSLL